MTDLIRAVAAQLGVPFYEFEPTERDAELTPEEREACDEALATANLARQAEALGLEDGD